MRNFHDLNRDQKRVLKPIIDETRKVLYAQGANNSPQVSELLRGGLSIHFGKGQEPRNTVTIQVI